MPQEVLDHLTVLPVGVGPGQGLQHPHQQQPHVQLVSGGLLVVVLVLLSISQGLQGCQFDFAANCPAVLLIQVEQTGSRARQRCLEGIGHIGHYLHIVD